MQTHKIVLKVSKDETGKKLGRCVPSKRSENSMAVGQAIRFEAEDPSNTVEMALAGVATFTPGQRGQFFQEFTAKTAGTFQFIASLTLPDKTVIEWEPSRGGEGEVH